MTPMLKTAIATTVVALFASVTLAGDTAPWVDVVNCAICSNLSAEEGLLENMKWEYHLTATGAIAASTVKPEFVEKYNRAALNISARIKEVMGGAELSICAYCTSLTGMMKDGATVDKVKTHGSVLLVISSTDDEMIARIRSHGQKTIEFIAEFMTAPVTHAGHNH